MKMRYKIFKKYLKILNELLKINYQITEQIKFSFTTNLIIQTIVISAETFVFAYLILSNRFKEWNILMIFSLMMFSNIIRLLESIIYDFDSDIFFEGEVLRFMIRPISLSFQLIFNYMSYMDIILSSILFLIIIGIWFYWSFIEVKLNVIIGLANLASATILMFSTLILITLWEALLTSIILILNKNLNTLYSINRLTLKIGDVPFEKIKGMIKHLILLSGRGFGSVIATLVLFNKPYKHYVLWALLLIAVLWFITSKLWTLALKRFEAYNL